MANPAELVESMQRAQRLAQAGDIAGAAQLCRAVLARSPAQFYALLMLGSFEALAGRYAEAEQLLLKATAANRNSPEALIAYGDVLLSLERHADAMPVLNRALALQPNNLNALIYRGIALAHLDRSKEALADFDRALGFDPRSVFALHNRTNVLIAMGRNKEAEADIGRLFAIDPRYVPAIVNGVRVLMDSKRYETALAECERGLKFDPGNATLWNRRAQVLAALKRRDEALASIAKAIALQPDADNSVIQGNILLGFERFDEAMTAFEKAIAMKPDCAEAHQGRANVLMERNRLEDALAACGDALAARSGYAPAHLLRANILLHLRRERDALPEYDAAIAANPDYADAHYHRGSVRLLTGEMKQGWADFEYRWKASDCGFDRPRLTAPVWEGEPLSGKSIVVYSEQGLGDTIQFARFLPILARMGARVTFLCHPNLLRLFRPFTAEMDVVAFCDPARAFDFQSALMSIPERLGTDLSNFPAHVPYVAAEGERVAEWRARIGADGFKIGIGWQGNPLGKIDRGRSVPLAKFAPLAIPGVRLISLQKRHGLDQLADLPEGMNIETLGEFDETGDAFIDTAAIMQSLDLIVTSDTATAHLAGALARPVWVALQYVPDWRWMLDRSDSPWYPTMRLFRQAVPRDWDGVFAEIARELRAAVGETR